MRVGGLSKPGPLREIYTGQENNNDTIGTVYNIFPTYILVTFISMLQVILRFVDESHIDMN